MIRHEKRVTVHYRKDAFDLARARERILGETSADDEGAGSVDEEAGLVGEEEAEPTEYNKQKGKEFKNAI